MAKSVYFDNICICYSDNSTNKCTNITSDSISTSCISTSCITATDLCVTNFNSVNAEVVCTCQQYVYLRNCTNTALLDGELSGVIVNKANKTDCKDTVVGVDNSGLVKVGKGSLECGFNLKTIATRIDAPNDTGLSFWCECCKSFATIVPTGCTDNQVLISSCGCLPHWVAATEVGVSQIKLDNSNTPYCNDNGTITISDFSACAQAAAKLCSDKAAISETNAATSATSAACCASAAATSASNAANSASNAATSASNACTSASNAATSASNACTSASNAETSASNAACCASAAATSATNAATSASNAACCATAAATSANNAATSATSAACCASAAATSASNAANAVATCWNQCWKSCCNLVVTAASNAACTYANDAKEYATRNNIVCACLSNNVLTIFLKNT